MLAKSPRRSTAGARGSPYRVARSRLLAFLQRDVGMCCKEAIIGSMLPVLALDCGCAKIVLAGMLRWHWLCRICGHLGEGTPRKLSHSFSAAHSTLCV